MYRTYRTASGNYYTFHNGRVSCSAHGIRQEPVWALDSNYFGCLRFRTPEGWVRTSAVMEVFKGDGVSI